MRVRPTHVRLPSNARPTRVRPACVQPPLYPPVGRTPDRLDGRARPEDGPAVVVTIAPTLVLCGHLLHRHRDGTVTVAFPAGRAWVRGSAVRFTT
jgi:hypothetical protein